MLSVYKQNSSHKQWHMQMKHGPL